MPTTDLARWRSVLLFPTIINLRTSYRALTCIAASMDSVVRTSYHILVDLIRARVLLYRVELHQYFDFEYITHHFCVLSEWFEVLCSYYIFFCGVS